MTGTTQREADERALFEEWAREACHMPDYAAVNWQAEWTLAAWEGFQAGRASLTPTAPQAVSQQADSKTCPDDIHVYTTSGNINTCMFCEKQWERAPQAATTGRPEILVANEAGVELGIERRDDGKWQFSTTTCDGQRPRFNPAATTASASDDRELTKWREAVDRDKRIRDGQFARVPLPDQTNEGE